MNKSPILGSNPVWNDQLEQRLQVKQKLDAVAHRHDGTLDNIAGGSDLDGYFCFCSYCDQEWRSPQPSSTCPDLIEAIAACEAAGCTPAEIAMVIRRSVE